MVTFLRDLILLFVFVSTQLNSFESNSRNGEQRLCPSKCECQKSLFSTTGEGEGEETDEEEEEEQNGLSVRCLRGAMNDTAFLALLQSLPGEVHELEIRAAAGRPNNLHWSDNINRLTQLRRLVLADCGIPALSQGIRLPLLSHLVLTGNSLEQIQMGSFIGMPMLERLDLSLNRISALPTGAFIYLKKLRTLILSHNRLGADLTASNLLRGPRHLRELHLDGNRLSARQVNELLLDMGPSLDRLELNNCCLDDTQIRALNLSAVQNLRRFGVAANNLTGVPGDLLRTLPLLDTLDLRDNLIRYLGPCSFCGSNISRVFLGRNLLGLNAKPIHKEAFDGTALVELDLSRNHFRQFDSANLFGAQQSLEVLHLSGNGLRLDAPLIQTLPRLRELHLAENNLRTMPFSLPKEYGQLTLLNLSSNGLDYLPPNLASLLPSLKVMDISHNQFSSFPHILMTNFLDNLDLVYLHNCPWDCQCAAQPLQLHMLQRLSHRELLRYDETLCAEPPLLHGQPLHRVQRINDCAVLFGAKFGITQDTELVIILCVLLLASLLFAVVLVFLLYWGRHRAEKGSYLTREQQQQQLTKSSTMASNGNGNSGIMTLSSGSSANRQQDIGIDESHHRPNGAEGTLCSSRSQHSTLLMSPNGLQMPNPLSECDFMEHQPLLAAGSLDLENQNRQQPKGSVLVVHSLSRRPIPSNTVRQSPMVTF